MPTANGPHRCPATVRLGREFGLAVAGAFVAVTIGCSGTEAPQPPEPIAESFVSTYAEPDSEYSPIVLESGQVSLNDRCMVREKKLNRRLRPLFVNGEPVGFC